MYKNFEKGRSMIEMLGVLAIVGVLSVGGIAGYSKAMEKFKINKLIEEYSNIIFHLVEHEENILRSNSDSQTGLSGIMEAMNIVPNTWSKINEVSYKDAHGNIISVYSVLADYGKIIGFDMYLGGISQNEQGNSISANFSKKLCFELLSTFANSLHSQVYIISVARRSKYWEANGRWGDNYCGDEEHKCLAAAMISDFQDMCKFCDDNEGQCNIGIRF